MKELQVRLRRFDEGIANGEAALAVIILVAMIATASLQAVLRNLTDAEVAWANDALAALDWIDPFLKKGTIWLAFIGASLATFHDKHIGIDVLSRVAPPRVEAAMKGVVGLVAGVTSFALAMVFWTAVLNNAVDTPLEYAVLDDTGESHICDASEETLSQARVWIEGCVGSRDECEEPVHRPTVFCATRSLLTALGATRTTSDGERQQVGTPEAASQLIMPVMFMIIAVRLIFKGGGALRALATGQPIERPRSSGAEPEPEPDAEAREEPDGDPAPDDDVPDGASAEDSGDDDEPEEER